MKISDSQALGLRIKINAALLLLPHPLLERVKFVEEEEQNRATLSSDVLVKWIGCMDFWSLGSWKQKTAKGEEWMGEETKVRRNHRVSKCCGRT